MIRGAKRYLIRPGKRVALKTWGKAVSLRYDIRNTACIFAVGRGGSTWLGEILTAVPGSILHWEPLRPPYRNEVKKLGFDRRPYFTDEHPPTPAQQRYLRGLLDGSRIDLDMTTVHQTPRPTLSDFVHFRRFVAKFVSASGTMDWVTRNFGVRSFLLLRHPCAVIASQMRSGWWSSPTKRPLRENAIVAAFPILRELDARAKTPEEILAFGWIAAVLPPLSIEPSSRQWSTVFYEDLVLDPMTTIAEIYRRLGDPIPRSVEELHGRPSAMVRGSVQGIEAWRSQLDADQQRRILTLVRAAGIDLYVEAPTPDRAAITLAPGLSV